MTATITRIELYNQVWSTPILHLSKAHALSGVDIVKICREHDIPRPLRGYWAKKEFGNAPQQTPLPDPGKDYCIEMRKPERKRPAGPQATSSAKKSRIQVAPSLDGCHALVSLASKQLQAAKTNSNHLLILPEEAVLDIRVSKTALRRSLLIMNALLKALEQRGYGVGCGPSITINQAVVSFRIEEIVEYRQEALKTPGYNRFNQTKEPCGRLELYINRSGLSWAHSCRGTWRDGKKVPLENRLNGFLESLQYMAALTKAQQNAEKKREDEQRAEKIRREELARLRAEKHARFEAERTRVEALRDQAMAWRESQNLREYIQTVRQNHVAATGGIEPESEFARWLEWANQQADRLDPFRESPLSILDDKIEDEMKLTQDPNRKK